ncbi:MAG: hypothetical protein M1820_007082 [Bogoriella megaspora]|nr:MAG: hypothetical protein M1820_007082 [Bogoriella megaspora]
MPYSVAEVQPFSVAPIIHNIHPVIPESGFTWTVFGATIGDPPTPVGFLPSTSDPYISISIDSIPKENRALTSENWGWQTISLYPSSSSEPLLDLFRRNALASDVVDHAIGSLGIGHRSATDGQNADHSSFLASLVRQAKIPSLSWGYTAGARYRGNASGSLVLGGFDAARIEEPTESFKIGEGDNNVSVLNVSVSSIQVESTKFETTELLNEGASLEALIDSAVHHLYLPPSICDQLQQSFGLVYDEEVEIYTITEAQRQANKRNIDAFWLSLTNGSEDSTVTIRFPYEAFDAPEYLSPRKSENGPMSFPLKKASEGPVVLGRTFLQESYVIADYERSTFHVASARIPAPWETETLVAVQGNRTWAHTVPTNYYILGNSIVSSQTALIVTPDQLFLLVFFVVFVVLSITPTFFILWRIRQAERERHATLKSWEWIVEYQLHTQRSFREQNIDETMEGGSEGNVVTLAIRVGRQLFARWQNFLRFTCYLLRFEHLLQIECGRGTVCKV